MKDQNRILIGIAGASGSGKSTIAKNLATVLGDETVTILQQDCYYKDLSHLSRQAREEVNFDCPDSIDFDLLYNQLSTLLEGEPVQQPKYDFATHCRISETRRLQPRQTIILEGILVFTDQRIRELVDISIFVEGGLQVCFDRRVRRDVNERGRSVGSATRQYKDTVLPMFLKFVEPTKKYADIVVSGEVEPMLAVDQIVRKIASIIDKTSS